MKTLRFEMILRAEEPIAHFQETLDNEAIFARERVRAKGGGFVDIPYVKANTMRHQLREAATYATLDAAGLLGDECLQSDSVLRLLFSGGGLQGSKDKGKSAGVSLDDYARMCDVFPPLALLGGATNQRILPGKISVSPARLLCEEQRITAWSSEWLEANEERLDSFRSHLSALTDVRMDPTLSPSKRALLTPAARADTEARLLVSETARSKDDAAGVAENKSTMMPYSYETLVRGSMFHWQLSAALDTDLEEDTLMAMLGAFLSNARVGGKRGLACGRVLPVAAKQFTLSRPSEHAHAVDVTALGGRVGALFRAHVEERRGALREWLSGGVAA